jgi:hypothetical protein
MADLIIRDCSLLWITGIQLPATLDPEVYSASNRKECQKQKVNVPGE